MLSETVFYGLSLQVSMVLTGGGEDAASSANNASNCVKCAPLKMTGQPDEL